MKSKIQSYMNQYSPNVMNFGTCLYVVLAVAHFTACKTADHYQGSVVNKSKGELLVYSSGDKRTFFSSERNISDLGRIENLLKSQLRAQRTDIVAINNLARIQVALGELEAAEKNCRTVLRQDLKNLEARKTLGEIAIRRGQVDLASIYLSSIGGSHSKDSAVINMLALIELSHGDNSAAMAYFKKAIKLNGEDLAARMNLGVLLVKHRMLSEAATQFERVLKISPKHADAEIHLAIVKASRGEIQDAQDLLERVLDRDRSNPLAHYNLAVLLRQRDEYEEASGHLRAVATSGRATTNDKSQAMALFDDIQRDQVAKGEKVEESERARFAAEIQGETGEAMKPKVASKVDSESMVQGERSEADSQKARVQEATPKKNRVKSSEAAETQQDLESVIK
jgi:tetratricopeptide (TPR) repeat protein